ncbi:alpha/beta hydrolase [Parasedimentitalea marina]|uniref:Alpha/beta hydrolase n=1 Tax=Parasedimentitalea marina TaxID=2483033 RepID=A0A3T0MZ51_9RHOB|nr:alpha/beta hydrolase [Parasedimentitalea marina]AZV77040.1 alpha/beta hydrolase [Parasedimentitalea marina]
MTNNTAYATTPTQKLAVAGETFAYREIGPSDGTPIVMLHHFTAVIDDWDPAVLDGLATQYRILAFDNRGVGGSTGTVPASIDDMAKDAVAFIQALGLTKVHLLGFSMGGFVAQAITLAHPELVEKLLLTGTGPSGLGGDMNGLVPLVQNSMARAEKENKHPKHFLFFAETVTSQSAGTDFIARLDTRTPDDRVPAISEEGMGAHVGAITAWAATDDARTAEIQNTTFIANGDNDVMIPTKYAFRLHELIPNSHLSIYPDAGHGGIFQYHELFVAQALEFLEGTPA